MGERRRVVVIGDLEATRLLCTLLTGAGALSVHLPAPGEAALRAAFSDPVDAVAVVVRGDVAALRFVLLAEHLSPGVRIVVTIFDRTMARQLTSTVRSCTVTSPADVAAPAVVAACLAPRLLAVREDGGGLRAVVDDDGVAAEHPWSAPGPSARERLSRWLPHRGGEVPGLLLAGLLGLTALLVAEWLLGVTVLHETAMEAVYSSARLAATVGPAEASAHGAPGWYLGVSALLMLLGVAFTGALVAGLVEWIVGARTVTLMGPRSIPRRDHVVVSGLGQVGLRVAQMLGGLGVPRVVVERDPAAANLPLARSSRIPVVIGDAAQRSVLARARVSRARAVAALGSDDLDNVAVVIGALGAAPGVRAVLRAGEDPAVEETTSLFRIGAVVDVAALTAAWVCACVLGEGPVVAYAVAGAVGVLAADGDHRCAAPTRCGCGG